MRARSHTPGQLIRGFTLIELMVVVVVAGILASIAIPAYQSYMMKSRRSDARTTLSAMVQAQERYRSNNAAYSANPASLLGGSTSSFNGHYVMTVVDSNGDGYVSGYEVHAKPNPGDPQVHDTDCSDIFIRVKSGILSYRDSKMAATATSSPCWPQ